MDGIDRRTLLRRAARVAVAAGAGAALPGCSLGSSKKEAETTTTTAARSTVRSVVRGGSNVPTPQQLRALARELEGRVVTPGSPGYGTARLVFDTAFAAVHPRAVAYCESTADVERAVHWAGKHGIHVVPRCGGHSYGGYSTVGNGVVLDVSRISSIRAEAGRAIVGAGAQLIDLYSELAKRAVTVPGGSCPTVGISGLALGGGIGYLARKYGPTSDNIRELTMVTANGEARKCGARENEGLYWASKGGGGGNFGVVTEFVFQTHPIGSVSTFYIQWPWADAARAVRAWQEWAPHAPDDLFSACVVGTGSPPSVSAAGQLVGPPGRLRSLLRPLVNAGRPTTVDVVPRSYMQAVLYWASCGGDTVAQCHLEPHGRVQRSAYKGKSQYCVRPLSRAGLRALVRGIESVPGGIGIAAILDSYGGAINRVPAEETAFFHRDALFSIQWLATWAGGASAATVAANRTALTRLTRELQPYVSRYAYVNYIDPQLAGWEQAYYGRNLARLVSVKRQYDPGDFFHFRQSIPRRM